MSKYFKRPKRTWPLIVAGAGNYTFYHDYVKPKPNANIHMN